MKIIHTADLHLGQIIYQNYDRIDEHRHFLNQLTRWCQQERPDALLVSGDVFDIQQPSATVKKAFTDYFVSLHQACPEMCIVITAGNHDSASRLQADQAVWRMAGTVMVGLPPAADSLSKSDGWQDDYIVALPSGFIVALPYMSGERQEIIQAILDRVAAHNEQGLPVVLMAHQAVAGLDITGHDFDIGTLKTIDLDRMGVGFDYLALGHIHKPQTLGHQEDAMLLGEVRYPAPVARYSGSALHVSCDEAYPHSVSVVEMDCHGGEVAIRPLRIDELRHFYVLPEGEDCYSSADEALRGLDEFIGGKPRGYVRFRIDLKADVPSNFNQMVYETLEAYGAEWRYNPKVIWVGEATEVAAVRPTFEVEDLSQMADPINFIKKTIHQYPGLELDDVSDAFEEVKRLLESADSLPDDADDPDAMEEEEEGE